MPPFYSDGFIWVRFHFPALLSLRPARDQETLLRIVAKLHGDVAEAEADIRRWGRGSIWIDPSLEQCNALGMRM